MEEKSIFDSFYEKNSKEQLAEQAQAIRDRKKYETGQPLIFNSELTVEEQAILDADLEQRWQNCLSQSKETSQEPPSTSPSPGSVPPPFSDPIPGFNPVTAAFQNAARKALVEATTTSKITPIEAMALFLTRACLRRFNGEYYIFDGYVFNRIPPNELNQVIFHYLRDVVIQVGSASIIKRVSDLVKSNPDLNVAFTTDGPDCQYFLNGALDHGILRSTKPNIDFFTTYCPFPYPTEPESASCPVFNHFLATSFPNDWASISTVWAMIGYLITRDMAGKCFFVLQGVPNSGKSVLGNLVSELLNPDAVFSLEARRFSEKYALHGLLGSRLNVCMDLPNGRLNKEAVAAIKQITGGDRITDEGKYANLQTAKLECKFLFGTNFTFSAKENDTALLERLIVIPFRVPVPPELRDPYLLDKLRAERPAIATRGLAAYQEVRRRNYAFALPRASEGGGNTVAATVDPIAAFLAECCDLCDQSIYTPTEALYRAYVAYCRAHGLPWVEQPAQFSRQLRRCCSNEIKPKKQRYEGDSLNGYLGIRLREGLMPVEPVP